MHHTTRTYILPLIIGTILSLSAFISVLWFVDPFASGLLQHIFFYLTLLLSSAGLFTLIGVGLRKKLTPGILTDQLVISFRQAILLSLLLSGMLLLKANNLLFWWIAGILILFIITIEIFFNA